MNRTRIRLAAAAVAIASLAFASNAFAATVEVTTEVDQNFVNDSNCSLREAIGLTNSDTVASANGCTATGTLGADTITFSPAVSGKTIDLTAVGDHELLVTDTDGLTISGPGVGQLTISAPSDDRVIESTGGVPLTLSGLTIQDGNVNELGGAQGGGIRAGGSLSLSNVLVRNNHVLATADTDDVDAAAGGVYGGGTTTIANSVIEDNSVTAANPLPADDSDPLTDGHQASATGGGVFAGSLTITDSTIDGNAVVGTDDHGSGLGEGVHVQGGGLASPALTVTRSTVSGNQVQASAPEGGESAWGGGVFSNGTGSIELSTIAGNTVGDTASQPGRMGGGIINFGTLTLQGVTVAGNGPTSGSIASANLRPIGALTVKNSIVADPVGATSTNCDASVASNGFNIDDGTSCGLNQTTDQTDADPDLGALTDHGGPTETMLPAPGSPAIDKGSSVGQTDTSHDQRGLSRPVESTVADAAGGDGSDIGAVEAQAPPAPTVTGTSPNSPTVFDTSPEVIGSTSPGPTSDESPSSVGIFSDSACGTEVDLGRGSPADFSTTGLTAIVEANATTTLYADASNDYGIASPCSSTFATYKHDSLGPVMTIDPGPSDSSDHTPTFTFHGTDASPPLTYECSVDTGTPMFAPCSSPFTSASLPDGAYTFRVAGTDAQGEGGAPASRAFTITTPAPTVTPPAPAPAPTPKKKCKKAKKHKASAAKKKCKKKK